MFHQPSPPLPTLDRPNPTPRDPIFHGPHPTPPPQLHYPPNYPPNYSPHPTPPDPTPPHHPPHLSWTASPEPRAPSPEPRAPGPEPRATPQELHSAPSPWSELQALKPGELCRSQRVRSHRRVRWVRWAWLPVSVWRPNLFGGKPGEIAGEYGGNRGDGLVFLFCFEGKTRGAQR